MGNSVLFFRNIRTLVFSLGLFLFFPGLLAGIPPAANDTLVLNLEKALNIALSDNPMIMIADKEVQRVDYARKEAWSALFPAISADGNYTRNVKLPVLFLPDDIFGPGTGGPMEMGFKNSLNGNITASVPLVAISLFKNIRLSEQDVKVSLESARSSKINMEAEVRNAYYTLLLANDSYEVMRRSVDNAEANLRNIRNLFSQGLVAEYDVIRSEVQVRNLKPALVQSENAVRLSQMRMRVLLGIGQEVVVQTPEKLADFEQKLQFLGQEGNFDLTANTDLIQLDLQWEKMKTQFGLVRSQRYPVLAGFANYQITAQSNDFKFGDYDWVRPFSVGMQLQIPLFKGFSVRHQEKQVSIGLEQMELQREYLERNLSLQVRNAYTNMQKSLEQIDSNREGVHQAERGYNIAQTRYNTGSGTLLELNDAEVALTQAKLNLNQAMYDYLVAQTEYNRILGREPNMEK